jgi:uncharacterized membrane protein YczE
MTSLQQLRAGRTLRRLTQLFVGLTLYGVSMAMMIRAGLGLDPWDVFHYGVAEHVPLSFGTVVIVVGALVLLLWVPLRQWPGLGTIANVVVIGLATDAALAVLPAPDPMVARVALLLAGVVLNGLAGALYIGSQFGPGPRDGLMTGLVRRTGGSIRVVRTSLELGVLTVGWLMGGVVGVGTVLYAVAIGPVVQAFLPLLTVPLPHPGDGEASAPTRTRPRTRLRIGSRTGIRSGRAGASGDDPVDQVGPARHDVLDDEVVQPLGVLEDEAVQGR